MQGNSLQTQQPQGGAVAQQGRPIDVLKGIVNAPSVQEQFKNALGSHKDIFVASLIDLYTGDKALQTCSPQAVVCEALRAATMGLPINKALGFAYIVVYNNSVKNPDGSWSKVPTPTFIPGYKGYIQLAQRSGKLETLNADVVYEGELRKVDKLSGTILLDGERTSDKVVGYFCYFKLLNGFSKTLYMSVEDMAKYAHRYSPSINKKTTTVEMLIAKANDPTVSKAVGWMGNFNDMALKTVTRRLLSRYGILSVEMADAVAHDKEGDDGEATRNDLIAEQGNQEVVDITTTSFEEVDPETGEVISTPQQGAKPAAAAPGVTPTPAAAAPEMAEPEY